MAPKKSTKKKTSKRKKSTKKKSGSSKTKRVTAGTDNIKSFMKMAEDMETAVYGFAGELRYNKNTEIKYSIFADDFLRRVVWNIHPC